jgi:hypothetical protein
VVLGPLIDLHLIAHPLLIEGVMSRAIRVSIIMVVAAFGKSICILPTSVAVEDLRPFTGYDGLHYVDGGRAH